MNESEYYVNVSTKATTSKSHTGGFVGVTDNSVEFGGTCYTTASVGMAENTNNKSTMGQFAGTGEPKPTASATLYASGSTFRKTDTSAASADKNGYENFPQGTKAKDKDEEDFYPVNKNEDEYLNQAALVRNPIGDHTTTAYDTTFASSNYPYPNAGGLEHHGDWTERFNIIYYEVYDPAYVGNDVRKILDATDIGNVIGFYATLRDSTASDGKRLVNTLKADKTVYDSGYMILTNAEIDTVIFGITAEYGRKEASGTQLYLTANDRIDDNDGKILDQRNTQIAERFFVIPFEAINLAPSDTYYQHVAINGQPYMLNQHFAGEAVNVDLTKTEGGKEVLDYETIRAKPGIEYQVIERDGLGNAIGSPTTDTTKDDDKNLVLIRSPWNLASMVRYTREKDEANIKTKSRTWTYLLMLDVDYTDYNSHNPGHIFDGNTNSRNAAQTEWYSGTSFPYGQASAMLAGGGQFNGNGHVIKNLYLASDTQDDYYAGLFGRIMGSTTAVRNVYMEDVHVNAWNGVGDGIYVGTVVAKVDDGATVENVCVNGLEMDFHVVPRFNSKGSGYETPNTITIKAIGGAVGYVTQGTVKDICVNGPSINLNSDKYTYYAYNVKEATVDGVTYKDYKASVFWADGDTEPAKPSGATKVTIGPGSSVKDGTAISIGGAIGEISGSGTNAVSVNNVKVIDPNIKAKKGGGNKVGGVVGLAEGGSYTSGSNKRPITIENSGVYASNSSQYASYGIDGAVPGSGSSAPTTFVGGFVGSIDKSVAIRNSFAAVKIVDGAYVGGFAGGINDSEIKNCYAGGRTVNGDYNSTTANVTGSYAGGFSGRIDTTRTNSYLRFYGTVYSTTSVKCSEGGSYGLFNDNSVNATAALAAMKEKVKAEGEDLTLYAAGICLTVGPKTPQNESSYLLTGVNLPLAGSAEAVPYDTDTLGGKNYPYKNETTVDNDGDPATPAVPTHYGDWVERKFVGAFYYDKEADGTYHVYSVRGDVLSGNEFGTQDGLTRGDAARNATEITEWGYGYFYPDGSSMTVTGPTESTATVPNGLETELEKSIGTKMTVVLVDGATTGTNDAATWTFTDSSNSTNTTSFYVNTAYGAAIEGKEGTTTSTLGEDHPYEIRTTGQLENIVANTTKSFEQTHDINGTGKTHTSKGFAGHYDGGFYRILDLTINNGGGLFDVVTGDSVFENIILYSPTDKGTITNTNTSVGGIVKSTEGTSATIRNCIVAGYTISTDGNGCAGGLVGHHNQGTLTIENCETTVDLSSARSTGGLVGLADASSGTLTITSSYAGGKITGSGSVGGLVGSSGNACTVTYKNVYSYVDMTAPALTGMQVYGIGPGTVDGDSDISEYWYSGLPSKSDTDTDPTGTLDATTAKITGKSFAQMKKDIENLGGDYVANEYLVPNADRAEGLKNQTEKFPLAAFVTDGDGNHYHYGGYPEVEAAGIYYHETESINGGTGTHHFYAYGGEIYNGRLRAQELIDTLCYSHHLTGEYASISDAGYGFFYTGSDTYSATGGTVGTTQSSSATKLAEALGVSVADLKAYDLDGASTTAAETWTISGSGSGNSVSVQVAAGYGAAIGKELGTAAKPFGIRTVAQLDNIPDHVIYQFKQSHDLDGKAYTVDGTPTGNPKYTGAGGFGGTYDGGGYRILELSMSWDSSIGNRSVGLFASTGTANAVLKNIILYSPSEKAKITLTGNISDGSAGAGGLVGFISGTTSSNASIDNCVVAGYTIAGNYYVGGLVGYNSYNITIQNSAAVNTLEYTGDGNYGVGGILGGRLGGSDTIENCYSGGTITTHGKSINVAGICGKNNTPSTTKVIVKNCYTYINMSGVTAGYVSPITYDYYMDTTKSTGNYYYSDILPSVVGVTVYTANQGTACNVGEMNSKVTDKADYTYVPGSDGLKAQEDGYTFQPVVTVEVDDGTTKRVHYGTWPEGVMAAGVASWEKVETTAGNFEYRVQIVGYDSDGNQLKNSATSKLLGDEFCTERHTSSTGVIEEHKIVDSGYALFTTTDELSVTTTGITTTAEDTGDKNDVIRAINRALNGVCVNSKTKVYSNDNITTGTINSTASVSKGSTSWMPLHYNPGMSGVSYEAMGTSATNAIPIRTVRQLDNVPDSVTSSKYFKQEHDLYGKPTGGTGYDGYTGAKSFSGTYDGNYYRILDLSMIGDKEGVGLFATTSGGAELKNIVLYAPSGATITGTGSNSSTGYGVGGLVGRTWGSENNATKIDNCVVAGYTITGAQHVGGLVGYGHYGVKITNSASVNDITNSGASGSAGGIMGDYHSQYASFEIRNCYSGGKITATGTNVTVGGICGTDLATTSKGDPAQVSNCYTYADMSGCTTATNVYTISKGADVSGGNNYYLDTCIPTSLSTGNTQGTVKSSTELTASNAKTLFGTDTKFGEAEYSYVTKDQNAGATQSADGMKPQTTKFPFPAVVTDKDGKVVHYGEWPTA